MAPYRLGVGTTGVIFAAIAVAWLAYLVPHFVRRRDDDELLQESDPADRFSDSMRIVRHGTAPLLDQDLEEIASFEVSTPQTRRAAINGLRRLERLAAARRRHVLLALMAAECCGWLVRGASHPVVECSHSWRAVADLVVVARISVVHAQRTDARYREIRHGNDESTIFLSRKDFAKLGALAHAASGTADAPVNAGTLWDPIPITMPTYVSKPLAPRTVRTIDLSGPGATSSSAGHEGPVTADAPDSASDSPPADAGGESRKVASA